MNIKLLNCPYCDSEQKVFHLNYSLIRLLENFESKKVVVLYNYSNPHKFIRNFNCKSCSEILSVYFNTETYQYFIEGQKLLKIKNEIRNISVKIKKLRKKIIVTYNKKIIEFLQQEIVKEELSLNKFIEQQEKVRSKQPLQLQQIQAISA